MNSRQSFMLSPSDRRYKITSGNTKREFCIYGDKCLRTHYYAAFVNLFWHLDEKWDYMEQFHSAKRYALRPYWATHSTDWCCEFCVLKKQSNCEPMQLSRTVFSMWWWGTKAMVISGIYHLSTQALFVAMAMKESTEGLFPLAIKYFDTWYICSQFIGQN